MPKKRFKYKVMSRSERAAREALRNALNKEFFSVEQRLDSLEGRIGKCERKTELLESEIFGGKNRDLLKEQLLFELVKTIEVLRREKIRLYREAKKKVDGLKKRGVPLEIIREFGRRFGDLNSTIKDLNDLIKKEKEYVNEVKDGLSRM